MTDKNGKLRIGVFGTGFWSTLQIPAWSDVEGVEVCALYNRTVSKAEQAAARFGVNAVYGDPEALLQNEKPDIMDIIVEAPAHEWLVSLGAKYKVPVICQKPMAHDWKTCEKMVEGCRQAGVPLLIHENYRWQAPTRRLKEALDEGHVGEVFRADIQLSTGGAEAFAKQPYLMSIKHASLFDMGCHIVDVARFLFGDPSSVYCQSVTSIDGMAGDDTFNLVLRQGRVICTCEVATHTPFKAFVEGRNGTVRLDNDDQLTIRTKHETVTRDCRFAREFAWLPPEMQGLGCAESIVACHRHMIASLKGETACETSAEETLKTMRAVFGAIESTETGRAVAL
ncbi:MAG: Gfo/Idh/MocA family oxidoreductase [Kiritimatiellae bacterium]|nr:Gfo/Idh/MocA family oxidoreductase [Kiritimatiellia bacterium]